MLAFFIFYKVKCMKFEEIVEMVSTDSAIGTGTEFPFYRFPLVTSHIDRMLKKKKKKKVIKEDLNLTKFLYKNFKHDKHPQVMVLDYHYEGRPNEKKKSDHLLGWNVNGYANKKEAIDTINDIDSFARMLSADKLEKYRRIKYFFPEQAELIRRYKKEAIKGLREKDGWFWKKTSLDTLEQKDKNNV